MPSTDRVVPRAIIARMNALSDLTTEVRFRERMRGYDYNEVDDYVKAVNRAAMQAMEQIAELQERLRRLDAGQPRDDDADETRETLVRTLVLAQRTADAAVAEARAEAEATTEAAQQNAAKTVSHAEAAADARLRSAEERAAQIVAESEENCRLIIAETKRTAAIEIASERERWLEELRGMQEVKADLEATSARIRVRLEDERAQLHQIRASFCAFVDEVAPEPADDQPESQAADRERSREGSPTAADRDESREESDRPPSIESPSDRPSSVESPSDGPSSVESPSDQPASVESPSDQPASAEPPSAASEPGPPATDQQAAADGALTAAEEAAPAAETEPEPPAPELRPDTWNAEEQGLQSAATAPEEPASVPELPEPWSASEPAAGSASPGNLLAEDGAVADVAAASDDEAAASNPATELLVVPELPMVKWLDESEPSDDAAGGPVPASSRPAGRAPGTPERIRAAEDAPPRSARYENPSDSAETTQRTEALAAAVTQSWPVLGDETPGLFDADAGEDEEFIEQLRRVVSSDAPLPDSEAAMSAFFDHDDGAVRGGGRGRSSSLRRTADPGADRPGPGTP